MFREQRTSIRLCTLTFLRILLDASQEIYEKMSQLFTLRGKHGVTTVTASRVSDMFNTDMQSLLNISVSDNFLARHTDGTLCDVEDDTSLAVVVFVW